MSAPAVSEQIVSCWVCGSQSWRPFKASNLQSEVTPEDFRITDARYGHTGRIDQCVSCGFKQCVELGSVLSHYEDLDDPAYDEGRSQRSLQAEKILQFVRKHKTSGRLLDVGAASGILVECAARLGFDAAGVEPSRSLSARAIERGLPVHLGVFPHPRTPGPFDVITLVDVIEHVPAPLNMMREITLHLAPDGIGVLTTPNVESLAAKVLRLRWWHFRVAHIGYFSRETLLRLLDKAGLEPVSITSPAWYFRLDYAIERMLQYFPAALRFKMPPAARRVTVRLNFHDSLQVIFRRKKSNGK